MSTQRLGRLGVVVDGAPLVLPMGFVLDGETVVLQTNQGAKTLHTPLTSVSFEVDHVDWDQGVGWSVLIQASVRTSPPPSTSAPKRYAPCLPTRGRLRPLIAGSRSSPGRLRAGGYTLVESVAPVLFELTGLKPATAHHGRAGSERRGRPGRRVPTSAGGGLHLGQLFREIGDLLGAALDQHAPAVLHPGRRSDRPRRRRWHRRWPPPASSPEFTRKTTSPSCITKLTGRMTGSARTEIPTRPTMARFSRCRHSSADSLVEDDRPPIHGHRGPVSRKTGRPTMAESPKSTKCQGPAGRTDRRWHYFSGGSCSLLSAKRAAKAAAWVRRCMPNLAKRCET